MSLHNLTQERCSVSGYDSILPLGIQFSANSLILPHIRVNKYLPLQHDEGGEQAKR